MLFLDASRDFVYHLRHERKVSPVTSACYQAWLNNFARWLSDNGYCSEQSPATLDLLNLLVLRRYQGILSEERKYRPRTILSAMQPLRSLCDWLVADKVIDNNPVRQLTMPKKDAAKRSVVSDDELARLLAACDLQRDKSKATFERAILSVLIFTGVRAMELLALRLQDINLAAKTIIIAHGKGDKSRVLYPPAPCVDALREWLAIRPVAKHDYVWRQNSARKVHYEGLLALLEDVKARAGLADATWIKPHSCRHAWAVRLMREKVDFLSIQAGLGHSQASTTMLYLHHREQPAIEMQNVGTLHTTKQAEIVPAQTIAPMIVEPTRPVSERAATKQRMRRSAVR